jgi:phospholipase/carboxylesterase
VTLLAAALLALAQTTSSPLAAAITPVSPERLQGRLLTLPNDAVAYVPASAPQHPPLLVLLHGAGRRQAEMLQHFEAEADMRGIVLLAPKSRGITWDAVAIAEDPPSPDSLLSTRLSHRFSSSGDARRVDAAISALSKQVPIDPSRVVLAGFSDGATFAAVMGLSRREPFSAVIAWSPGIALENADPARGRRMFVSHGRQDPVLAFAVTCGDIVPLLQGEGAAVTFVPFDGGHDAPAWLKDTFLDAAFGRVAGSQARPLPASAPACHGTAPNIPSIPQQPPPTPTMMGPG